MPTQECTTVIPNSLVTAQQKEELAKEYSVLIVDDDPAALKLLGMFLAGPPFSCTSALSGKQALERMATDKFDAVVSDLRMPGISGLELLLHVRQSSPRTAFIVTTGVEDLDVALELMRADADDYLVKPLRETVVISSLRRALRKQEAERCLEEYRLHLEEMVEARTQELKRSMECLRVSYEGTLRALGRAVDLRDGDTAGHSWRVCRYSLKLASAFTLSEYDLSNLARGAYLHDIGKLGIPDKILLKPGALTKEERRVMQRHAAVGFELLKSIPFLADAADIVFAHHENFDGSGYPRGLKGNQIPFGARIFAVADTLDAITSGRVYQPAASFGHARDVIRADAGSRFDPEIVKAFLSFPIGSWKAIAKDPRHIPDTSVHFVEENAALPVIVSDARS